MPAAEPLPRTEAPLHGLRVIEFTHMVMGPCIGLMMADMGAEVIRVEPEDGDQTRRLKGSGAGYFAMYNRNKKSVTLNLKSEAGLAAARRLIDGADVVIENFRTGTLDRLGLGYDALSKTNPRLIFCAAKGFLSGPYEERTALDEVAQMMGGLAYMTGPKGRPLRAGASVIDVTGGMFGVIGILAALEQRHRTGQGQNVQCSLFETTAFMVGQHIAQGVLTGIAPPPMTERTSAWAIYDLFETSQGDQVFIGVVSDAQWRTLCEAFGLDDFAADETLAQNNQRIVARDRILGRLRPLFKTMEKATLLATMERIGLPFAPVSTPMDLLDDPHLNAGGFTETVIPHPGHPDARRARLPALPIEFNRKRPPAWNDPPAPGQDNNILLED